MAEALFTISLALAILVFIVVITNITLSKGD